MTEDTVLVGVDGSPGPAMRRGGRPPTPVERMTAMPDPPRHPYWPWTAAWTGMAALAVANGLSRGLYADRLGDNRAHQISTATLVAALLPYTRAVERRWPLPTDRAAARVGATWVALTVAFEFGFGHYVAKQSWATLLADYDLRRGRLWPLVLAATAAAPTLARRTRLP